ncbi:MAG UNVERIFIED_CONTAM: glycosyltransferase family 39 protein [Anaerolineae bacterium]|jgi:4-amino-4-deoxy-L-arabinose transferase-like glycosyltransferase
MKRFPRFDVYFFPLVVVLLVATWFRLQGVTALSVSTDEGWSTWAIQPPHFEQVIDKLAHDRHPPFYFLILSYWSKLAGDSHLALRLPSILAGVLTTAIVFRMGMTPLDGQLSTGARMSRGMACSFGRCYRLRFTIPEKSAIMLGSPSG